MHDLQESPGRLNSSLRIAALLSITSFAAWLCAVNGFNFAQITSATVFTLIITAATLFWDFHLPIAFVGIGLLMVFDVMNIPSLIVESKLDIILFLMGMMVIVGVLKDLGLFSWIIIKVISIRRLSARMFVFLTLTIGALLSCLVDEVTSVVFMAALIFQVCDSLNLKPVPFIIMSVMAANVGSVGAMLGNPVGILIGQEASPPLSFIDFMIWSFPLMLVELMVVYLFLIWSFRREVREMENGLKERRDSGLTLGPIVQVPFARGFFVLVLLMVLLSLHTVIEDRLGLGRNTMLITTPMLLGGLLMILRRGHVHKYITEDVEWSTLIFFMMLFVVAGTLKHTRVTDYIADGFIHTFGDEPGKMIPVILGVSALGSAFIENIIFVAAFMPIVVRLEQTPFLWALLHGACLGGTITMIGSTANIAAVSLLEKRYWTKVNFFTWLRTGLAVGVLSLLVAWFGLAVLAPHMPTHAERLKSAGRVAVAFPVGAAPKSEPAAAPATGR